MHKLLPCLAQECITVLHLLKGNVDIHPDLAKIDNQANLFWLSTPQCPSKTLDPATTATSKAIRAARKSLITLPALSQSWQTPSTQSGSSPLSVQCILKDNVAKLINLQVVMKIVKACAASFPTTATGSIVGMDTNGTLEITNSFPFPAADVAAADSHPNDHMAASNLAAAAPRSKANVAYANEMIKNLREVNVDANNVGWYTSANMGNFINNSFIENQFFYQKEPNEKVVALVHDVSRSSQGALALRAFRLSPAFMTAFKENKFTTEK